MKCTITIETSDFSDLKALIGIMLPVPSMTGLTAMPAEPDTPGTAAASQTVKVTLRDPDTGERHVITRKQEDTTSPASYIMLTPMGPMPVVKAPAAHEPDPAKKELAPTPTEEKIQPVAPGSQLCEQCHMAFIPKQKNSRYCSDKCSQKAYTATYKSKKTGNVPVMAQTSHKPRMSKEEQDLKLKELREKYPVNNNPPKVLRDFV